MCRGAVRVSAASIRVSSPVSRFTASPRQVGRIARRYTDVQHGRRRIAAPASRGPGEVSAPAAARSLAPGTLERPVGDLTTRRSRSVRVGISSTVLALATVLGFVLLPGHGNVYMVPFMTVWCAAAVSTFGISLMPWERMFTTWIGQVAMYVWSVADIIIISFAVTWSGAGSSPLWVLY